METHEFWLKKYPEKYNYGTPFSEETLPIYRVALGELIDATQRKTYPLDLLSSLDNPNFWNKSGSIGFMDLTKRKHSIPIEGARQFLDMEYDFLAVHCEEVETLTIAMIGIEEAHRRKGHARFLKKRAEEIASEWGLDFIVAEMIQNDIMRAYNARLGYQLFDNGSTAVKRLKSSGL